MRIALGSVLALTIGMAPAAKANDYFMVVLHAGVAGGSCTASGVPNCIDVLARTHVAAGELFRLYILVYYHTEFQAFQTCLLA